MTQAIITIAKSKGVKIALAESCTGGMVAAGLTDYAGASAVVDRGFITYSNAAKIEDLNVPAKLIESHGAVSKEVVVAMAEGAAQRCVDSPRRLAISVSGVAGPDGGSEEKPVGLVWFGLCQQDNGQIKTSSYQKHFEGDRREIRSAATDFALGLILTALDDFALNDF